MVSLPEAEHQYRQMLLEARNRGLRLTQLQLLRLTQAFRQAVREIRSQGADRVLTRASAARLRAELLQVIAILEGEIDRLTRSGISQAIDVTAAVHRQLVASLVSTAGLSLSRATTTALERVNLRAAAAIAARRANAATFKTLLRRHVIDLATSLDRLLIAGVARGVASERLTRDVASLLARGQVDLAPYGLEERAGLGVRSLLADARRIAVTETNNAWREANAQSLRVSPVVRAVQWQLSGRHHIIDECDVLASSDFYGFGPGFYPPDRWPVAPHPNDACYQGAVILRPPSEWTAPLPAAPALRLHPARMTFPHELQRHWTPRHTERIRQIVAAALAGERPARRRAA